MSTRNEELPIKSWNTKRMTWYSNLSWNILHATMLLCCGILGRIMDQHHSSYWISARLKDPVFNDVICSCLVHFSLFDCSLYFHFMHPVLGGPVIGPPCSVYWVSLSICLILTWVFSVYFPFDDYLQQRVMLQNVSKPFSLSLLWCCLQQRPSSFSQIQI